MKNSAGQKPTKVVIVGGGTSGWMTASYVKRALQNVDVTVLESADIRTIGVGEATFSTLKLFFDFLGLSEHDWMPACNGTYKMGIKFVDWTKKKGHFYHPFQRYDAAHGFTAAEWWLKLLRDKEPFDSACFVVPALCEALRSPRYLDGTVFDEKVQDFFDMSRPKVNSVIAHHMVQYPYGYHFDAKLVADFLKQYSVDRGVKQIIDEVADVCLDDQGYISHLQTKRGDRIAADLFVDCTGFRGLLINGALEEPFTTFNDSLPNDRAVAFQPPWDVEAHGIRPYTTATALSAGWAWTIPLYHRNGMGYVYCSEYITPEEAEKELRRHAGPASDACVANHIQMRVGRNRNSWVKNCVAIGLSSGFVEPLESTGIFFIQHGIEELVNHFPAGSRAEDGQRLSYNKTINECIDGVREFLTVHYAATDRDDTQYWRDTKRLVLPASLAERMRIWRSRLPGMRNIFQSFHGFEAYSYSCMLLGLNYLPEESLAVLDRFDPRDAQLMFQRIRERADHLVRTLPSQYDYLTHVKRQRARFSDPVRMVADARA